MHKYLRAGALCRKCGTERVEINHSTLEQITAEINPSFNSIPRHVIASGRDVYAVCPKCDAYALGIELTAGFPFTDKNGDIKTINDIGGL